MRTNSILLTCLAALAGCGNGLSVGETGPALICPDNGSRHFALIYGDDHADWDKVIASKPAFVVLGDHKANSDSAPPSYFHNADPTIRVIAYVPMNDGHSYGDSYLTNCARNDTLHHVCDNTPMSWDCTSISIRQRVQNAMASGYDGIFFDETPNSASMMDYVHDCAALVKQSGANRLVIMNPGTVPLASMFNNDVDIVSVEHAYNSADYGAINSSPWRWLSVEDGIGDLATAEAHFNAFTAKHGYWYGGGPSYSALASFYAQLASYIDQHAAASCSSVVTPPSTGSAAVTVHTYDLDKSNAEVTGLWTVVTDAAGKQTTGFSPLTVTVPTGTTSLSVSNYPPYTFDHWTNGSTAQPLQLAIAAATTVGAYYHSTTTAPPKATSGVLTVRSYDADKGNAEITGLWTVVTDSAGKQTTGFSPLAVTVPVGTTSVSLGNYGQYTFEAWDDGETAQPRSLTVSGDLTVRGYYHSKTTASLVVHTYDLDKASAEVTGLWTVVTDVTGKQTTGFSPLTVTVPFGSTSVSLANYPPYTFNHWDDSSTAQPRVLGVNGDLSLRGYYHSR